jgi:hypothetical protein
VLLAVVENAKILLGHRRPPVAFAAAQGGPGDEQSITIIVNANTATVTGADGCGPGRRTSPCA